MYLKELNWSDKAVSLLLCYCSSFLLLLEAPIAHWKQHVPWWLSWNNSSLQLDKSPRMHTHLSRRWFADRPVMFYQFVLNAKVQQNSTSSIHTHRRCKYRFLKKSITARETIYWFLYSNYITWNFMAFLSLNRAQSKIRIREHTRKKKRPSQNAYYNNTNVPLSSFLCAQKRRVIRSMS